MRETTNIHHTLHVLLATGICVLTVMSTHAKEPPMVTANNYVRAETDFQMKDYVEKYGCFGRFHHGRDAYDVNKQVTIRANRDTLYSFGVFDLRSPVTLTLPETGGRYQSLMIENQDHSIWSFYGPRTGTLTEEKADNFLPIVPGWNYIVRMYQPGPEILNGTWTFPSPEPVE